MADARYVLGRNAKLYYKDDSQTTWTEILCRDVNVSMTRPEIDTSERGMEWATQAGGMKTAKITTQVLVKSGSQKDDGVTALQNNFLNDTAMEVYACTGTNSADTEGISGSIAVINFSLAQTLNDVQLYDVEMVFDGETPPVWNDGVAS